ncbi:unnamed protein product, partial [Pylaiella littoralis]
VSEGTRRTSWSVHARQGGHPTVRQEQVGFSSYGGMSPRRLGGGPMNMLCGGVPALGFPSRVGPDQSRECMNSFTQTPTLPCERSNRNARHRVMLGIILYRPMRKSLKL